jgi:ribosomal protein S12 methylthiotransferase
MRGGSVLPYLDVPFQHASPRILKLMKRPANVENNLERIRGWRAQCPEITLRSTFIVGFPGETEREFQALLAFLEEAQLDRVGCFAYSPVEGASANALPDPVPDALREERRAAFMATQARISASRLRTKIGRVLDVLVDEVRPEHAIARSEADAPEIDGIVTVERDPSLAPGKFARVRITGASEHDLSGRVESGA